MGRLNLTLDSDTEKRLERHARRAGSRRASFARDILREGLARREEIERTRKLAADYVAGRKDAERLLAEMEEAQLELLGDEEA